jgi:hypothetical protein
LVVIAVVRLHRHHVVLGTSLVTLAVLGPAGVASADPVSAAGGRGAAECQSLEPYSPDNFSDPTRIDNRYLPLVPGTQLVYEGQTAEGSHQVVFSVTDLVKEVDGVTTRVIYDVDLEKGVVVEAELAFFAQDYEGSVRSLGEYPEEFKDGEFVGAPDVWLTGMRGAQPGIHMPADPEQVLGIQYLQGRVPSLEFLDCATIVDLDGQLTVPAGSFTDILTTHETSPLDSTTAIQTKEHAPNVGIVRIGAIDDPEGETLKLTQHVQLEPQQRDQLNQEALALDAHGREDSVSPIYRRSSPVQFG